MRQIGFTIETVNGFKLIEIGSLAQLETKALNDRTGGLEIHVGLLWVQAHGCVMGNVLLQCNLSTLFQRDTACGLTLQVCDRDGDIASLLLEPLHLLDHHGVAEMHLTARHEASEHTKWVTRSLCFENLVHITVGKDDPSAVEFGRRRKVNTLQGTQPKLLDDTLIIG